MTHPLHLAVLGILLAVACASDVAERRVPNVVVAPLAAFGLLSQWLSGGVTAALAGALCGSGVLALLILPWATGKLGGGDVKLAAAVAVWVAPSQVVAFVLFSCIAGIPVALVAWAAHRLDLWRSVRSGERRAGAAEGQTPSGETVPMAVAISLGAFALMRWGPP